MFNVRICDDLEEAERCWTKAWPKEKVFDLWPVRASFQREFNHKPHFIIAEDGDQVAGMLALSRMMETRTYAHFPGELWAGGTWLEQNRIISRDENVFHALVEHIPGQAHIRYLTGESLNMCVELQVIDEMGYLFYPGDYQYSFKTYLDQFPGKSRKKILQEVNRLESIGVTWRYDSLPDLDRLFKLNQKTFREASYFSDARFLRAFQNLANWLQDNGMLRITAVELGGKLAAVDMGSVYKGRYTLLAGGTNADFPGVAKLINLHHMERACREHMISVDFLCGDFGWKERFRLTPRPLFKMDIPFVTHAETTDTYVRAMDHAV